MRKTVCRKTFILFIHCVMIVMVTVPTVLHAARKHKPEFTWQIRNGVVFPERWIYDGDTPIAMFDNCTSEQPGQQLMFFNKIQKPIVLRYVKLTPDGNPLVDCIQLYCKFGPIITDRLIDLDISGQGTDKLVVTFTTQDRFKVATSHRVLNLTYDNEKGSYIYDFNGDIEIHSPENFNGNSLSIEFTDPFWVDCPAPALEFPGMWGKRYQNWVYEADDGSVKIIPINHYTTSHKSGIRLKRDGMFVTAFEPDGNPAIQFVGDTAEKSRISICWWGYDYHLSQHVTTDELFEPIPIHFRIFQCPNKTVQNLLKKAVVPKLGKDEWKGIEEYPVYERISSFDKGLRLDGYYKGKLDPFPWTISGNGAEWDKTYGRTDKFSLKIDKTEKGLTRWHTFNGDGEGFFMDKWTPCKGYRVSCYVKTEKVTDRGSTLAVQNYVIHPPQEYPIITTRRITGTHDWTKLEVEIGPPEPFPPVIGTIMIYLQQDGSGTTWFDDLEVIPLK